MNKTRTETLLTLRYAVRVLERLARLWSHIGTSLKFASIISGTVALAALVGSNTPIAIGLGVVFGVLQALEHAIGPADKRAQALAQRRHYALVLAAQAGQEDAALEAAYEAVNAADEITVGQALRELAYNDVVAEQGLPQTASYPDHKFLRALS